MKRSVNFAGSRATQARKHLTPSAVINAMRKVGMTDEEIIAALQRAKASVERTEKEPK